MLNRVGVLAAGPSPILWPSFNPCPVLVFFAVSKLSGGGGVRGTGSGGGGGGRIMGGEFFCCKPGLASVITNNVGRFWRLPLNVLSQICFILRHILHRNNISMV